MRKRFDYVRSFDYPKHPEKIETASLGEPARGRRCAKPLMLFSLSVPVKHPEKIETAFRLESRQGVEDAPSRYNTNSPSDSLTFEIPDVTSLINNPERASSHEIVIDRQFWERAAIRTMEKLASPTYCRYPPYLGTVLRFIEHTGVDYIELVQSQF